MGCGASAASSIGDAIRQRVQKRNKAGIDWKKADPKRWTFPEVKFSGKYSYVKQPELEEVSGLISTGLEALKSNPVPYEGLFYQSAMVDWPEDQQKYKLVKRTDSGFEVKPQSAGTFTWMQAKYQPLLPDFVVLPDKYTDSMSFKGHKLAAPRLPGRGQGCNDVPGITMIDVAHPLDVEQGAVGDCWLLSAMSAVAEYAGVIPTLFKKTPNLSKRPLDIFNEYTITLYDLSGPEWKPVDIIVDERLCSKSDNSGLLGAHPSDSGELWVSYLEKAVAAHCGGWDAIDGGVCVHAWRLLLGCRDVYTFKRQDDGCFACRGDLNPTTNEREQLDNSPHKGFKGLWPMAWPEVGGGGDRDLTLNRDDFFHRLCAWDKANYIMACGSEDGSDRTSKQGIVQGHAYTLLKCVEKPGGANVDLVEVRNPWGKGEFSVGKWTDEGSGWSEHPEVKAALKPEDADDGVFWMDKDELFRYFPNFYLCALDMTTLTDFSWKFW